MSLKTTIFSSSEQVAAAAAAYLEDHIRQSLAQKDTFSLALSGGRTPWEMLKILSKADLPWERIYLFQVDERLAPDGHPDRNLTQLFQAIEGSPLVTRLSVFPMPVTAEDLQQAAQDYAEHIQELTGDGILDLVHLGLGSDGHTASLIPADPVCELLEQDIATTTHPYQGRHRMTMTYPLLNRARQIFWIVTGSEKVTMLRRLQDQDQGIPAGKISQHSALLFADQAAAGELDQ